MDDQDDIRAYHGTPHDFDRFDLSKIGTGQGQQAYGHGLYFASDEDLARSYRDDLSSGVQVLDDRPVSDIAREAIKADQPSSEQRIAQYVSQYGRMARNVMSMREPQLLDQYDELTTSQRLKPAGKMYEVRIKAHPDTMLDWDKPLLEQPAVVKMLQEQHANLDPNHEKFKFLNDAHNNMMNERSNGSHAHHYLKLTLGSEGASQYLNGLGVKGIKYRDAGSRGMGEGTTNYVIFDDSLVNIARKYRKGGAVQAMATGGEVGDGYAGGGKPVKRVIDQDLAAIRQAHPLQFEVNPKSGAKAFPLYVVPGGQFGRMELAPSRNFAVVEGGSMYRPWHVNDYWRHRGFRAVEAFASPLGPDEYIRGSKSPNDFVHIENKTHRGSYNHNTGEPEGGLSVSLGNEANYPFNAIVRGRRIGEGSDSEPLLDLNSVEVVRKFRNADQFSRWIEQSREKKLAELGLTPEDYSVLRYNDFFNFRPVSNASEKHVEELKQLLAPEQARLISQFDRRFNDGGDTLGAKATGGEVGDETPYHQTPEFQNWFGDSVAHTDGVPTTYYHGTSKDKDYTSFNIGKHGLWVTTDPAEASGYAEQNDSQGYTYDDGKYVKTNTASRVLPVHIKAENPYRGDKPEELFQKQNYKKAQSDWFEQLRSQGYDSWIPDSQRGGLAVILKAPTQIKSIYNRSFDPKNKRMDKAPGGSAVATLRRMSDPAVNEAIRVINRSGSSPRDAVTLSKRLLGRQ